MSPREPIPPEPSSSEPSSSEPKRPWLAGYFYEPAVWPITIVLLAHAVLGLAIALLDALRHQGVLSILVLSLAAGLTAWAIQRAWARGALGRAVPTLLIIWSLGALCAWGVDHAQLY